MLKLVEQVEGSPAPRVALKLEVEYRRSYGRNSELAKLANISITGAFLEGANSDLRTDDKISITFKVGGRTRKIPAQIVWTGPRGAGIRFIPANNRDVQIVDDLMYFVESKREGKRDVLDDIFERAA
jgi:hypothetical protein